MKVFALIFSLIAVGFSVIPIWNDKNKSSSHQKIVELPRWEVKGDFNGDGREEILKESYTSSLNNKEIILPQIGEIEYDSLVSLVVKYKPQVSLISSDDGIRELFLVKADQLLGVSWLKNLGDIDRNGTDEISVVIDWADWSSVNTCRVFSFRNDNWDEIAAFEIRDWQMSWVEGKPPFKGFIQVDENGNLMVESFSLESGEIVRQKLRIK